MAYVFVEKIYPEPELDYYLEEIPEEYLAYYPIFAFDSDEEDEDYPIFEDNQD